MARARVSNTTKRSTRMHGP